MIGPAPYLTKDSPSVGSQKSLDEEEMISFIHTQSSKRISISPRATPDGRQPDSNEDGGKSTSQNVSVLTTRIDLDGASS